MLDVNIKYAAPSRGNQRRHLELSCRVLATIDIKNLIHGSFFNRSIKKFISPQTSLGTLRNSKGKGCLAIFVWDTLCGGHVALAVALAVGVGDS